MKRKVLLVLAVLVAVMCTSCVSRLGAFTVISTKNIDWSRASEYQRSSKRVDGSDVCHIIVFVPTQFNVTIEDAVDEALESVPGAVALIDAVLRERFFYIPYVYGQQAYIVEGSVLIDPKLADVNDEEETIYYQGFYDKNKELKVSRIEKAEFDMLQEQVTQGSVN